jgi:hypothetical protein
MACEVTATGYLPLVYARTPEGKVPLQGHAACCRRTQHAQLTVLGCCEVLDAKFGKEKCRR